MLQSHCFDRHPLPERVEEHGFHLSIHRVAIWESEWTGPEGVTIFGELVSGEMALGEKIALPLRSACQFEGEILRFTESFKEWVGLPFYDMLSTSSISEPFCIHVYRRPETDDILVPGVASLGEGILQTKRCI